MVLILLIKFLLGIPKVEFKFVVTHCNENIVKLYLWEFCNDMWIAKGNSQTDIAFIVL